MSAPDFIQHRSAPRQQGRWLETRLAGLIWVSLLVAVLWTQSLGLVHKAMHAPGWWPAAQTAVDAEARPVSKAGLLAHLGAEGSSSDCLFYDQLVQTADFRASPVVAVSQLPALPPPFVCRDQRRINPALFEARGPPVSEIA